MAELHDITPADQSIADEPRVLPTIHDVARQTGVSSGTVSHVLNHPERVAESTRIRVLCTIEQLGFVHNGAARHLRVGMTNSIGLVVLDMANPFFAEVVRGVEYVASQHGHLVFLCNSHQSTAKEQHSLRVLEEQRVAGVIILPMGDLATSVQKLRHRGISLVQLDDASPHADCCSVAVDDVYGGLLAGQHLLGLGHRRLAYVHGSLTTTHYGVDPV